MFIPLPTYLMLLCLALLPLRSFAQEVFINEIHYDNLGSDTGEAIEVAGPSGADLTGWQLVLYNGSNSATYDEIPLEGAIPDQQAEYGTLAVMLPSNDLQNGSPDGIALVDPMGAVIQFLSYEGQITATDGPAIGMTSIDISVEESNSTPVGSSLTLMGNGAQYADFVWRVTQESSFGEVNGGETFAGFKPTPVINEFVLNHTGPDTDEFVEILGAAGQDLASYWLISLEGDGPTTGTIDAAIQLGTADVDGFYTIPFSADMFENGTQTLLLVEGFTSTTGADLDADDSGQLDSEPWDTLADGVAVSDAGSTDQTYTETVLLPNFDGGAFTVGGASRTPSGTDTNGTADWVRNSFNGAGLPSFPDAVALDGEALNTPNTENQVYEAPATANLLISELDADTEGTDTMEFIELYDGGVGKTTLDEYVLVFYNGSNDASYAAYDLEGQTTDANGYFVIGNLDVPNVALTFDGNGLQNGADAVALYQGSAADFPNGASVSTENLVDAVVYDTDDADDEGLLTLLMPGQPQVNENNLGMKDMLSIQRFPNASGNGRETDTFVNAVPTPGTANTDATEPVTLVINELDADTPGSDSEEFVELYDGGKGNTSLDGFVLVNYNGNDDLSNSAIDFDGYSTNASGYFVIGNEAVFNVDLIVDGNSFQNGADAVVLYRGSAGDFPSGTAISTDGIIDAIVYGTGDDPDIELLVLLNDEQLQLDEDVNGSKDSESLQRIPNGAGGARNTSSYVAQTPTPGKANDAVVTPGEVLSIADVRATAEGETVTFSGILTVSDQFSGPAYIQDATGGIAVFDETVQGDGVFSIGDSITVTGTRTSFNSLAQVSPVNVVSNNSPAKGIIEPKTITLAQLSEYPGQLVRVENISFPNPGDLLFGSSNFTVTGPSGSGELRIDGNAKELVGLAQPESCDYVIGVVGRFNDTYQLMPRLAADIPCASPYKSPDQDSDVPNSDTFDVVAWNLEWFGDENNGPAAGNPLSDSIQRDSVLTVLKSLDADVIAVEEVSDEALFADLVSRLDGYDFILSDAFSYPEGNPPFQKLGFIYRKSVVTPISSRPLLASIDPIYNGGDDSALVDYPSATSRFYASGRLPFLMTADVTINGVTEQFDLVALHARANSGNGSQNRYDMRKYDVEVLKDSLDVQFADRNLIMLGDYNDDVDETVADGVNTTVSSFEEYVNDPADYNFVTAKLSAEGKRSFVSRENMIDHILITNELFDNYLDGSVAVNYQFYDNDYTRTASDHFPVSARFVLAQRKPLALDSLKILDATCHRQADGMATVTVSGGNAPYSYLWSDGQTTETAFNLAAGIYSVEVTDSKGATLTVDIVQVGEPDEIQFTVPEDIVIYKGYDQGCKILILSDITAEAPYTISWSTGDTGNSIEVCPDETTTYTVTVTGANGCTKTKDVTVTVNDVTCGGDRWFPHVQVCYQGRSLCVNRFAAYLLLQYGGKLGSCGDNGSIVLNDLILYPNPVRDNARVSVNSTAQVTASFEVYNFYGTKVYSVDADLNVGHNTVPLALAGLPRGVYVLKPIVSGVVQGSKLFIKR